MTEQNTQDQLTPPTPAPAPVEADGSFAAYDKDLLRFVGGVHPTKAKAKAAAKDKGAGNVEIRPV